MYFLIVVLALVANVVSLGEQPSAADNECLRSAHETHYRALLENFDKADYVTSAFGARHFYQTLWTKPITTDQLRQFCKNYVKGVKAFDACANSTSKDGYLLNSGLAGYICKKKLEAFATNAPCLQNAMPEAKAACGNRCTEFENGSKSFIEPGSASPSNAADMTRALIDDCRYLKCKADCHLPIFGRKCTASAAGLQLESLYVMESLFKTQREPPQFRAQFELMPESNRFPKACRLLADAAANLTAIN